MFKSKAEFIEYVKGFKFWVERARGYALWINILLLFDLWRGKYDLGWDTFFLVGITVTSVILVIDYLWIYPGEVTSATKKNPQWTVLMNKVDETRKETVELREMLKRLLEK